MAYAIPLLNEDEKKKQQEAGSVVGTSGQTDVISGSSQQSSAPSASAGQGSQSVQQSAAPKKSGSGWTNLSTYFNANQGQGQRMANDRTDNINADVTGQKQKINQETNTFLQGQGVYNPEGKLNTSQFDTKGVKQDFKDYDYTKANQQDFNKFYNQDTDFYKNFKPAQEKPTFSFLKDPGDIKNESSNFNWRVQELQDEYGKGGNRYDRGMQNFDAMLLGKSNLADQRMNAYQGVKDYAFKDPNAGVNLIDKEIQQYGTSAKNYDAAIDAAREAYRSQYANQLANVTNQFKQADQNVRSIRPSAQAYEVDAQGNIMMPSTTAQKADKVYTAPNGKKYAVVVDKNGIEKLIDPAKEAYSKYSKLASFTNQKVDPMAQYDKLYQDALNQAIADATSKYTKANAYVEPPTVEKKQDVAGVTTKGLAPMPIKKNKDGTIAFNNEVFIPAGTEQTKAAAPKISKAVNEGATKAGKAVEQVGKPADLTKKTVKKAEEAAKFVGSAFKKGWG